jgi:hypothetical protein
VAGLPALAPAASVMVCVSLMEISALRNYQLQGFSVERLMNFLALDRDVEIVIHHKSRKSKSGRILVTAA